MPHGYNGKILHIHLDRMELELETPAETFYRTYAGGSALGTYYLLKYSPVGADPLGPENTLILSLSVLTGTPVCRTEPHYSHGEIPPDRCHWRCPGGRLLPSRNEIRRL